MPWLAALILNLTSGFAADALPPPGSPAAGYLGCLIKAVEQLDDAVSDAATVARAVFPMCDAVRRRMLVALEAGKSPADRSRIDETWSLNRQFEVTIALVLKTRAIRRQNAN